MSAWSDRPKRERRLIVAFGVVVVLAGGMKVLASGSEEPVVGAEVTAPVQPKVTVSNPETGTPAPSTDEPEDEAVVHPTGPGSRRDPFQPLVTAGEGPQPIGELPMRSDDDVQVLKVDLVDIYVDGGKLVAMVDLDEERFRGGVGKVLGETITVVELSDRCGVFEHADARFGLCVGQSIERQRH